MTLASTTGVQYPLGLVKLPLRDRLKKLGDRLGLQRDWYLIVVAAGIGTITALGAIAFKSLLDWTAEHGFEIGEALPLWLLPVVPIVGALLTGLIVYFFAPEAKGHGVPEVMDALYRKGAKIRPRVALAKSMASICTIGSGGSAGAEGPIVQIGSAIGSGLAQLLKVPRDQGATLLGCGAAAGIASVFNAPIAGVFFVMEILLRDFSLRTFTPIVVASVFSTASTQAWYAQFKGEGEPTKAIFAVEGELAGYVFAMPELPSYVLLGIVCGFVAVGFIKMLYFTEDLYDKVKLHPIVKPITGAALLGGLGIAYLVILKAAGTSADLPHFFGNGYETITTLLRPGEYAGQAVAAHGPMAVAEHGHFAVSTAFWALLLMLACKATATCFTLGSGGSGGVFAPSLFLGASSGAAFGVGIERIGLIPENGSPAGYALVGMAAVVAATTHAPLTAMLMLFEITGDYKVILPIMLAAVMATLVAQMLLRDSIYSLKLRRRGVLVGTSADLTLLRKLTARDIIPIPPVTVHPDDPLARLFELQDVYKVVDFVVVDHEGRYEGLVTAQDLRTALIEREAIPYLLVDELERSDLPTIHPDETLDMVLEKFSKHDVASLVMMQGGADDRKPAGLISRARLMKRYQESLAQRH